MAMTTIYSRVEAAQYLGLSVRTLDRYQQEGLIEKCQAKPNGRVTYREEDLIRFQSKSVK